MLQFVYVVLDGRARGPDDLHFIVSIVWYQRVAYQEKLYLSSHISLNGDYNRLICSRWP